MDEKIKNYVITSILLSALVLLPLFPLRGDIDQSIRNDDIFGLLALLAAGEPIGDEVVSSAKNFVIQNQNADGGWAFAILSGSDTNMTAMAIMALLESGVSKSDANISKAIQYLKGAQNSDDGFPYD